MVWSEQDSGRDAPQPPVLSSQQSAAALLVIVASGLQSLAAAGPFLLMGMMALGMGAVGLAALLGLALLAGAGLVAVVIFLAASGLRRADPGRIRTACGWGLALVVAEGFLATPILGLPGVAVAVVAVVLSWRTAGTARSLQTP